ncbi:YceG-like family protein [compost metagenome]
MFKNRHFMMGLGIGLIVGAVLLQLMNLGQRYSGQLATKQQIEEAAGKLGLKVVENEAELLTEEEWKLKMENSDEAEEGSSDASADQGTTQTEPVQETEKPTAPEEPKTPESADTAKNNAAASENNKASTESPSADKPAAPAAPAEPKKATVEYKVAAGSTLTGIAEGLQKSGVISDKDAFIKKAKEKKVNTKIRTGTYHFVVGEDYISIITKLTAKPKY